MPSVQVLMEFNEYATEIDDEFVRKSVRCIGRCAIKLDNAAERYRIISHLGGRMASPLIPLIRE
jgi:hypothetical protein